MNNLVRFRDSDGRAPDDIIVVSNQGEEIRSVTSDGPDIYVKVDETAFTRASENFLMDSPDYNTMLTIGSLRNIERGDDSRQVISEQVGVRLSITGDIRSENQLIGDVNVAFQASFDDGNYVDIASFEGVAGGYGNGAPENGQYMVSSYHDRSPSGWYNRGMNRDGIGFSFNLDPDFDTGRSLLRIHPDGNNEGTLGCIGMGCFRAESEGFSNTLNEYLDTYGGRLSAEVDITNNPNNDGRGGNTILDVNE